MAIIRRNRSGAAATAISAILSCAIASSGAVAVELAVGTAYRDIVRDYHRTERECRIPRDEGIGTSEGSVLDSALEGRILALLATADAGSGDKGSTGNLTIDERAHLVYMLAMGHHDGNNFRDARTRFVDLVAQYSNAQLVDDATYMIGYEYYLGKDYATAIEWFSRVERCADRKTKAARDRVPFALYMTAVCRMELRQNEAAIVVLEDLKVRYPKHAKVREANRLLGRMQ
jgi:TolA-binding protein